MRRLLFLTVISLTSVHYRAYGMECPGPMEIEEADGLVTLVSSDGQEFEVELSIAKLSGTLPNLIEDVGTDQAIPLPNISGATLQKIITLLEQLYPLVYHNKGAELKDQVYIPRAYQPTVNLLVQTQKLSPLIEAANYLDIPFIINGLAAVIADRIHAQVQSLRVGDKNVPWDQLDLNQRLTFIAQVMQEQRFGFQPKEMLNFIARHVALRKIGITQEYSIADYIKEHGQPKIKTDIYGTSHLDLSKRKLTSIFGIRLVKEKKGTFINLSYNGLDFVMHLQLPKNAFNHFTSLRVITLNGNPLTTLPPKIFSGLTSLQGISLYENHQLTTLPSNLFSGLTSLQSIGLGNNQLTKLPPKVFSGLTSLKSISLSDNQLSTLPPEIFSGLTSLQSIWLGNNQLTTLPSNLFSGLTSLNDIDLKENQLTTLPSNLFSGLTKLEYIGLNDNQLTTLPPNIFSGLTSLQRIDLEGNQLTTLPPNIFSGLTSLQRIDLEGNQLTTLPTDIFNDLASLEEINLNHNQLTKLPPKVFRGLTSLKKIRLGNNQLTRLPRKIFTNLTKLKLIALDGNKLLSQRAKKAILAHVPKNVKNIFFE